MKTCQMIGLICTVFFSQQIFAAGITFEWMPRSQYASSQPASNRVPTGSSGTLITVDGKGGAGDSITLADIAFFEFTHEWEDSVTGETGVSFFDLTDLISQPSFPLIVSANGAGLDSGSIQADNGTNRLRMIANQANPTLGDVNDNYVVDEFAQTNGFSNGWNGGGFGAWVNTAAVPVPAAVWLFSSALLGLIGFKRRT